MELEGLSTARSHKTESCRAYFLESPGSTGSMYLCLLGVGSRGGLVRGASLGTITLVTLIMPDWGVVAGVEDAVDVDDVEEGIGVVADELLDELDELRGEGFGVTKDV